MFSSCLECTILLRGASSPEFCLKIFPGFAYSQVSLYQNNISHISQTQRRSLTIDYPILSVHFLFETTQQKKGVQNLLQIDSAYAKQSNANKGRSPKTILTFILTVNIETYSPIYAWMAYGTKAANILILLCFSAFPNLCGRTALYNYTSN